MEKYKDASEFLDTNVDAQGNVFTIKDKIIVEKEKIEARKEQYKEMKEQVMAYSQMSSLR